MLSVQLVAGSGLSSEAIEWFEGYPAYSHVDIVLPDGSLLGAREDAIGGQPPGVRVRPPEYEKWEHRLLLTIGASQAEEDGFYGFARAQLGKPYDKLAILAFLVDRNWRDEDAWFCSELVAASLENATLIRPLITPANKLTPGCLATVLSAIGATISFQN